MRWIPFSLVAVAVLVCHGYVSVVLAASRGHFNRERLVRLPNAFYR